MTNLLRMAALLLVVAGPLRADTTLPEDPEIRGVIGSQLDAFLAEDPTTAFSFASPMIQGRFGTAETFGDMVRNGYPMVWAPDETRFLELREIDGKTWQKVMVRDGAGAFHVLDYEMIQTEDGWKINGVQILGPPGVGA